jgi:hypothetical protein
MNIDRLRFTVRVMAAAFAVSSVTHAQDQQSIVGSWQTTISPVPGGPQFTPFPGLITINADGTVVESDGANIAAPLAPPNPFCNCTVVAIDQGHGVWKKIGDRKYQIKFLQIATNADDSSLVLTNTLQFTVELSGGANDRFQGSGSFLLTDAHGTPVQGFAGPEQIAAQRITTGDHAGAESAIMIKVSGGPGVFPNGSNTFQVTTNQITLDASQSSSSTGSALSYNWVSSAGFQPVAISGANTAAPIIQLSVKSTYQLTLTATDANGSTAAQTITIQYV